MNTVELMVWDEFGFFQPYYLVFIFKSNIVSHKEKHFAIQRHDPLTEVFCEAFFSPVPLEWFQKEISRGKSELGVFLLSLFLLTVICTHTSVPLAFLLHCMRKEHCPSSPPLPVFEEGEGKTRTSPGPAANTLGKCCVSWPWKGTRPGSSLSIS